MEIAQQASRVNAYIPGESSHPRQKVAVENTSDLPAYSVSFAVETYKGTVGDLIIGTISPCTKVTVDLHATEIIPAEGGKGFNADAGAIFQFWDSRGHAWWRDTGSEEIEGSKFNPPSLKRISDSAEYARKGLGNVHPSESPRWEEPSQFDGALYVQPGEIEKTKATSCG